MMSEYYPYGHQSINDDDIASVIEALKSDWLTTGPAVDNFESAVASRVGADYAVSFSSGTAALHGAMHAAGVSSGDSVIVPSLTFAATGNAAIYRGGRPVIADISPDTLCMSRSSAERAIATAGSPIRVIAPVSYAGYPVDIASFMELAGKHDAVVIEDASHAMGAARGTRTVGQEADMTVFSFHPLKHITTGEGGMVVTNSETFAKKLRLFRSHGITKSPDEFGRKYDGPWDNDMIELGYNYRLTDLACALGSSQLKRLDTFIAQRRAIAARYRKSLSGADGVTLPPEHPGHAYHLFPIQVPHSVRRKAFESLRDEGIGVQVHYVPLHLHSYYRKNFGTNEGDCPNAEAFSSGEISLPIYPDLSNESAVYIADKLKNILTAILR